jgi:hypothetical protein
MRLALATTLGVALALLGTAALAARNSSGTFTLSPSSPFITGTPIASATMNTRFSDLGTEITDSLSRSGKGPMLSALALYSGGSATVPELSWGDDSNSGLYLVANDDVALSIGGVKRCEWTGSTFNCSTLDATFGDLDATGVTTLADVTGDDATFDTVTSGTLAVFHAATFADPVTVGTPTASMHATTKAYVETNFATVTKMDADFASSTTGWKTITGLTSPSYAAGARVSFSCAIIYNNASGDLAFGVTGPASPTSVIGTVVYRAPAAVDMVMNSIGAAYDDGVSVSAFAGATTLALVHGAVKLNANGGTLSARVNPATTGILTVYAGSSCTWN